MLDSGYALLHEGTLALARAEMQGIRLDVEACERKIAEVQAASEELRASFAVSPFGVAWGKEYGAKANYDSGQQLAVMIRRVGGKVERRTAAGGDSVDEETLKSLGIAELSTLLRMRKLSKIGGTYLKSYLREQVDGVIHPSFSLHTVVTYRSSSSNPNLQNVPIRDEEAKDICRSVLFPRKGHVLMEIDWSGCEVSAAACYHKDPEMLKYLRDPKSDMHGDQAVVLFRLDTQDVARRGGIKKHPALARLRQAAKNGFVFPEFYGDYYLDCARNLACNWGELPDGRWRSGQGMELPDGHLSDHLIGQGMRSLEDFIEHVKWAEKDFWKRRFRVYDKWRERWFSDYQRKGYFDTLTGFRVSGVMRRNEAINYPVQGTAFHWLLKTLIETDKVMLRDRWDTRIIGEIHDSMMLDVHPDETAMVIDTVRDIAMVQLKKFWPWIIVPIAVEVKAGDVDAPWSEIHGI